MSDQVKRLPWRGIAAGEGEIVLPDIIVHRRGTKNNLLVIEAKKDRGVDDDDRKKLQAFTRVLQYEYSHAVFIRFITGNKPDIELVQIVDPDLPAI